MSTLSEEKSLGSDLAYPAGLAVGMDGGLFVSAEVAGCGGLTKRELFAAMAMQGLLSNWEALARMGFKAYEVEQFAIERAEGLLKELAK